MKQRVICSLSIVSALASFSLAQTTKATKMNPAVAVALVFLGCCSNVIFLEELVREFPKSGNLITFAAFVFNALEGVIFTSRFFTREPSIPLRYYGMMVALFFVVQTLNNYVLGLNVSMPLQMIFRSGSLVANLVLGYFILKRRYTREKYLSVLMITIGIICCTIASAGDVESQPSHTGDELYDCCIWLLGISLLVLSLFLSARMGIFQEQTYARFGKHPSEALFYNHLLPLPGFLLLAKDIHSQVVLYNASSLVAIPVMGTMVPRAWLLLAFNTLTHLYSEVGLLNKYVYAVTAGKLHDKSTGTLLTVFLTFWDIIHLNSQDIEMGPTVSRPAILSTSMLSVLGDASLTVYYFPMWSRRRQDGCLSPTSMQTLQVIYVCIQAVFVLTTECTSLTVTLVVTLRKFVSLMFSIIYFNNPFTPLHWVGAVMVFGGTFVFTEVLQQLRKAQETPQKEQ